MKKIGIIGHAGGSSTTLVEAMIKAVEAKTGEKIEVVTIHEEDIGPLTAKIDEPDPNLFLINRRPIIAYDPIIEKSGHKRPYKFHK